MHNLIRLALQTEYTEPRAPDWINAHSACPIRLANVRVLGCDRANGGHAQSCAWDSPGFRRLPVETSEYGWYHDHRHGIRSLRTLTACAPTLCRYRAILRTRRHGAVLWAGPALAARPRGCHLRETRGPCARRRDWDGHGRARTGKPLWLPGDRPRPERRHAGGGLRGWSSPRARPGRAAAVC